MTLAFNLLHGGVWKHCLLNQFHNSQTSSNFPLDTPDFSLHFELWNIAGGLTVYINRLLTIYIMIQRLRCIQNVQFAGELQERTPLRNCLDTVLCGMLPGVVLYLCRYAFPQLYVYALGLNKDLDRAR